MSEVRRRQFLASEVGSAANQVAKAEASLNVACDRTLQIWRCWNSKTSWLVDFCSSKLLCGEVLTADCRTFTSHQGSEGDPLWQKVRHERLRPTVTKITAKLLVSRSMDPSLNGGTKQKTFPNFANWARHQIRYKIIHQWLTACLNKSHKPSEQKMYD